jgi:putative hemolysin
LTELLIILALVLVNGFFAMSELALVSAKRARLQVRAEQGSAGAKAALALLEDPTSFLSSVQVGISLISIVTGVYSGAAIAEDFGAWLAGHGVPADFALELAFVVVVVGVTFVSIIFGELIPKRIAMNHAETLAVWTAPPMRAFAVATAPLVWLLRVITNAVLALLPVSAAPAAPVTEDEVRAMVDEGTRAGVFEAKERQLIDGVLALADRRAVSVMVPRQDIVWLDLDEPLATLWQQAKESGHSRFLAARGTLDNLLGTISLANLSEALRRGHLDPDRDLEVPLHVPDGISVLQLLDRFQGAGAHLAVITDEYGDIEGVATPLDILKAIAGELPDAGSRGERAEIARRDDGSWLVDGHLAVDDLQQALGRRDLAQPNDYQTAAGFVLWRLGRIPKAGDVLEWRGLRVEVIDMDGARIDKLIVAHLPHAEDPSG